MANLAISVKDSNKIIHFIYNCKQFGDKQFIGSNRSVILKPELYDLKWTNDNIGIANDGYDKGMSDLSDAISFEGFIISSREDVNNAVKEIIAKQYSIDYELKLHGEYADNTVDKKEWQDYRDFVKEIKNKSKVFKDKYFKSEVSK